jgi:Tfp pilus assembly major pilin PilA
MIAEAQGTTLAQSARVSPETTVPRDNRGVRGFTVIELLVVAGIILVMAGVLLPSIGRYLKNYKVRGSASEVASVVQAARFKAISRNVNLGVIFTVPSTTTFQWVLEDDASPFNAHPPCTTSTPGWGTYATECKGNFNTLLTDPVQASPVSYLTSGIVFSAPANCNITTTTVTDWGIRFNRFGAACGVSQASCLKPNPNPLPAYSGTQLIALDPSNNAFLCVYQPTTGVYGTVRIAPGGRILTK